MKIKKPLKISHSDDYQWHYALNAHSVDHAKKRFMYEAKHVAEEVNRLPLLFKAEREKTLPQKHRQCSHSAPEDVPDNHLTCCLGVKCKECGFLRALEEKEYSSPDVLDQIKAFTCVTHIVAEGGDVAREGYILTTDDRMYWDNVYASLAAGDPEPSQ